MASKTTMKKILVVDDEEDILWSLKEFLVNDELQAQVITAGSGEEALEKLARERIDLVITDIKMPGISGFDLLVEIKNRFPYIAVIVMTAFPSSEFKRESLLKGGIYFVEKPFDIRVLRQRVIEATRESGQFKGMLSGISLSDVILIKCMSGVTTALRVTEGHRQGIIFFQKGEIIHALCDDLDGEAAFYEIIAFSCGNLDTVNIAELPERTIFIPYTALLMEGALRLDERERGRKTEATEDSQPAPKKLPELEGITFAKKAVATVAPEPHCLSATDLLSGLKEIKGYRAAALLKGDGEMVAGEVASGCSLELGPSGGVLNDFYRQVRAALERIGLDSCQEIVLGTRAETVIMGYGSAANSPDILVLAVFGVDGNQALARREMRKIVSRLKELSL